MHRKLCRRYDEPGHVHALTFTCFRRLPLLGQDRSRGWLIEAIDHDRDRAGWHLWAYVIMPDHVHLLVAPVGPSSRVSQLLWWIKRPVGRRAVAYLRVHSPRWLDRLTLIHQDGTREHRFWQAGGGYDRNITESATAWRVVEYIHQNPVRRGLAAQPEDWAWSSAPWYADHHPVLLDLDGTPPPIDLGR